MFSKLAIATAVVVVSLSGVMAASAATKAPTATKVYVNGKYVGADPDPTIRAQLAHDPSQGRD